MNRLLFIISFVVLPMAFYGQSFNQGNWGLRLPNMSNSHFLTTFDSTQVNYEVASKVTSKFGFSLSKKFDKSLIYRRFDGAFGVSFVQFATLDYSTNFETKISVNENLILLPPGKKIYFYGFITNLNENSKVDRNFSKLLMSAYQQEISVDYLNNGSNFTTLAVKDKSEFWRRNWINMGYGVSYLAKDNPFMGGKALAIGFCYIWEALHYFPIFVGPFIGETKEDKILIPIVGISSLLIWKSLFSGLIIGNRYLGLNNGINRSGYKVPSNLEY